MTKFLDWVADNTHFILLSATGVLWTYVTMI